MAAEVRTILRPEQYEDAVRSAVDVLRGGGLVAFPTETVYGIGARVDDPHALKRLRDLKSREPSKPFTVHIGTRNELNRYVPDVSPVGRRLAQKGWPGPLTLIFAVPDPAAAPLAREVTRDALDAVYFERTVGLRCPDDFVAERLLRDVQAPIVATSANRAGQKPATSGSEVIQEHSEDLDLILDVERTRYAQPSTIVRIDGAGLTFVRAGVFDERTVNRLASLRILFVCSGNTCRSPMAAALAGRMLATRLGCEVEDLPAHRIYVDSAGVSGGYGTASEHALSVMRARGIDLSGHRSQALSIEAINQSDHIFAMTRAHLEAIVRSVPSAAARATLLLPGEDLPDPFGGREADYEICAKRIESAISGHLETMAI